MDVRHIYGPEKEALGVLAIEVELRDVPAIAAIAHLSPAHFSRCFRDAFGETPHRYLQRRRVERPMFLLRETGRSVTEVCFEVGFASLGTFSRTFRVIVGETPSGYRRGNGPVVLPGCVQMAQFRISALTGLVFTTDDAHKLFETLKQRGVTDFTQEPTKHFYGIDLGLRDPFGNPIRVVQQGG